MDLAVEAGKNYLAGSGARRGRALGGGSFKSVMKSVGKVVKPLAKKYGPAAMDLAVEAGKSYLSGSGARAGARGARGGRRGRALMPAGYGMEDEDMYDDEYGEGLYGESILGDMKKGFKKYAPAVAKNVIKYGPLAMSLV